MSGRIRNDAPPLGEPPAPPPEPPRQAAQEPPGRPPPAASPPAPEPAPAAVEEPREAPSEAPAGEPTEPAPLSPELKGRFDRLTRERYEARRIAEEAQARLAEYERQRERQRAPQPPPYGPPGETGDAEERAYQRIRGEEEQRRFNQACNDLYARGKQEFGEGMDDAVRNLNAVGFGNRPDALAAITQLPDSHRVYRTLGADMENAARVLALPPMQMAVELARLAVGGQGHNGVASAPPMPAVTQAPEPRAPIGGHSRPPARNLAQMSMAEFIRTRDREERLGSRIAR